jgi:hypothetical protein
MIVVVALALIVTACSDDETTPSSEPEGQSPAHRLGNDQHPVTSVPAERLVPCSPSKQGGGYDLLIEDISCPMARRLLVPLGDPFSRYESLARRNRQVVSQQREGWTSWSELATDYGPIHNVCWRGQQTMVFDEG